MSPFELEIGNLLIEVLNLEDVKAGDIDPEAPLFNEGLGLDSIDALEISLVLSQNYGIKIKADDADNVRIFSSLKALCSHIESKRQA